MLKKDKKYSLFLEELCEVCDGTGEVGYTDAAGDFDQCECKNCSGCGYINRISLGELIDINNIFTEERHKSDIEYLKCEIREYKYKLDRLKNILSE